MSEAKHTPGPWRYQGGTSTCEKVLCDKDKVVADTWWCRGSEESEANARLIAAAPELLEASMKVLEWFEAEDDHSKADFYQRMQMCRDAEEMIRAAIAKATRGAA